MSEELKFPQEPEIERAILGFVILDNKILDDLVAELTVEDFFSKSHQKIFSAMIGMSERGIDIHPLTLHSELQGSNIIDEIGGMAYISSLIDGQYISRSNISGFIKKLKVASTERNLLYLSRRITVAVEKRKDAAKIIEYADNILLGLAERKQRRGLKPVGETFDKLLERIEARGATTGSLLGIPTGFTELDATLGGLQKQDFILLAARPSMGKTAASLNIAEHAAAKGHKVGYFSLEMSEDALLMRLGCSVAQVDSYRLRTGRLTREEWRRLMEARAYVNNLNLFIDDTSPLNLLDLRSRCRRMKNDCGLDLIVLDYVGLMRGLKNYHNRNDEISAISNGLKNLAKELDVPLLALSQLSRGPEQRADHRPNLADLRDSGSLEQDADVVIFIYREEYYTPSVEELKGRAEFIISKQRNGETGIIPMRYYGPFTRFSDLSEREVATYE